MCHGYWTARRTRWERNEKLWSAPGVGYGCHGHHNALSDRSEPVASARVTGRKQSKCHWGSVATHRTASWSAVSFPNALEADEQLNGEQRERSNAQDKTAKNGSRDKDSRMAMCISSTKVRVDETTAESDRAKFESRKCVQTFALKWRETRPLTFGGCSGRSVCVDTGRMASDWMAGSARRNCRRWMAL